MTHQKIMSATSAEFFRSLSHLRPEQVFDKSARQFELALTEGTALISFKKLPDRQVTGLLALPQLEVSIAFEHVPPADQDDFLKEFDLAFRRGGG